MGSICFCQKAARHPANALPECSSQLFPSSQDAILIIIILKWAQPRLPMVQPASHTSWWFTTPDWNRGSSATNSPLVSAACAFLFYPWAGNFRALRPRVTKTRMSFRLTHTELRSSNQTVGRPNLCRRTNPSAFSFAHPIQSSWHWSHVGACPTSPSAGWNFCLPWLIPLNKTFCDRELETLWYEVEARKKYAQYISQYWAEFMNGLHYISTFSLS